MRENRRVTTQNIVPTTIGTPEDKRVNPYSIVATKYVGGRYTAFVAIVVHEVGSKVYQFPRLGSL